LARVLDLTWPQIVICPILICPFAPLSGVIRQFCPAILGCKILRMNWLPFLTVTLPIWLACTLGTFLTQDPGKTDLQPESVAIAELSRPTYPPLGRQARIAGEVDLMLRIRQDGSVESAAVVSGHPLLAQTALDSAQHSRFECKQCETVTPYRLVYTFQLVEPKATTDDSKRSQPDEQIPRVTQSLNHITVVDQAVCICQPPFEVHYKVRSAKCLYLWRCGTPRVRSYE